MRRTKAIIQIAVFIGVVAAHTSAIAYVWLDFGATLALAIAGLCLTSAALPKLASDAGSVVR